MLVAFLVETPHHTSVRLTAGGHHVAKYSITQTGGPSPTEAATAVLAGHGWQVVDAWEQTFGGITGTEWMVHVTQADVLTEEQ